jgi:hypothetical protein
MAIADTTCRTSWWAAVPRHRCAHQSAARDQLPRQPFATESFIDEIARKQGEDPVAYHLELLKSTPRAIKVVERVAQMAEWGKKREGVRALGFAYLDYSGSQVAGIAEISPNRTNGEIKVHNFWCTTTAAWQCSQTM